MSDWSFSLRFDQSAVDRSDDETSESDIIDIISDDARRLRDLDLSLRPEQVCYKPNPWSIAKINAVSRPPVLPQELELPSKKTPNAKEKDQTRSRAPLIDAFKRQLEKPPATPTAGSSNPHQSHVLKQRSLSRLTTRYPVRTGPCDLLPVNKTPSRFLADCSDSSSGQTTGVANSLGPLGTAELFNQRLSSTGPPSHTDVDQQSQMDMTQSPIKSASTCSQTLVAHDPDKLNFVHSPIGARPSPRVSALAPASRSSPACSADYSRLGTPYLSSSNPSDHEQAVLSTVRLSDLNSTVCDHDNMRSPRCSRILPKPPIAAHSIEPLHRIRTSETPDLLTSPSHHLLANSDSLNLGTYAPQPPPSRHYHRSPQITRPPGWLYSILRSVPSGFPTGDPRSNVSSSPTSATCNYGQVPSTLIQSPIQAGEIGENISPVGPSRELAPIVHSGSSPHSVHTRPSRARTSVSDTRLRLSTVQTPNSGFNKSQPKRKLHSTVRYPLAQDDTDPDASWSTLPARKVAKANTETRLKKSTVKTSGVFRLPIPLTKRGDENDKVNTTKARVITYLPPPMARDPKTPESEGNASERSKEKGSPPNSYMGIAVDDGSSRLQGPTTKRKRMRNGVSASLRPGEAEACDDRDGNDPEYDDLICQRNSPAASGQQQRQSHAIQKQIRPCLPSPPTSDDRPTRWYTDEDDRADDLQDIVLKIDVDEMGRRYPKTKYRMVKEKRASASVWDMLNLPSFGILYQDGSAPSENEELPIMIWDAS